MLDLVARGDVLDALIEKGQNSKGYKWGESWELNLSEIMEAVESVPYAEPDNQVHLCDSCHYGYPVCPAMNNEVIFGNGKGHDNICACAKYIPSTESVRKAKVMKHKYWLGVSLNVVGGHTIGYEWICENCKKKVLNGDDYCSHCGARLEWNETD